MQPQAALTLDFKPMETEAHAEAFRLLNEEWITRFFSLEQKDLDTLNHPRHEILNKGGHVYLGFLAGEAVACVALIALGGHVYELSKMAVSSKWQGRGLGRQLLQHAIQSARSLGAVSLFLGSSTKLPNAIHLYESAGFRHVHPDQLPPMPYKRADVFMELRLIDQL